MHLEGAATMKTIGEDEVQQRRTEMGTEMQQTLLMASPPPHSPDEIRNVWMEMMLVWIAELQLKTEESIAPGVAAPEAREAIASGDFAQLTEEECRRERLAFRLGRYPCSTIPMETCTCAVQAQDLNKLHVPPCPLAEWQTGKPHNPRNPTVGHWLDRHPGPWAERRKVVHGSTYPSEICDANGAVVIESSVNGVRFADGDIMESVLRTPEIVGDLLKLRSAWACTAGRDEFLKTQQPSVAATLRILLGPEGLHG